MRFDAIAFDLDGTLYPAYSLFLRAAPSMVVRAARLAAYNAVRVEMRAQGVAIDAALRDRGEAADEVPARSEVEFRQEQAKAFARRCGMSEPEAAAYIEKRFTREIEELFARIKPFRGAAAALDALAAEGLRLAVLSDLPPRRKLELLGLEGRFEFALCSEESGYLKPARAPFELLERNLGLGPERILYVGNSPKIDLGAKAAGMAAAIVSRHKVPGADFVFYNWNDLVTFALGD